MRPIWFLRLALLGIAGNVIYLAHYLPRPGFIALTVLAVGAAILLIRIVSGWLHAVGYRQALSLDRPWGHRTVKTVGPPLLFIYGGTIVVYLFTPQYQVEYQSLVAATTVICYMNVIRRIQEHVRRGY